STKPTAAKRPARGTPAQTRARLVVAAAEVFNRDGYHGTDSNCIARAAGYAPGTFYKHFPDKRAILLAVYEEWVTNEWAAVEDALKAGGRATAVATRVVDLVLGLHRRWRGVRASLLSVVATDPEVRRFYRGQRRRQLRMLRELRAATHGPPHSAEEDAVLLFTLERTCDAVANGELQDLGLCLAPTIEVLRKLVRRHIARDGTAII
ncbi:MAG TPA: TetR/AcrR family transcriptional regulator, partial [Candidatus Kryptonia bacterium]|nr:TetR/AcrR family transcriptional regulator [Candidatus Kryptonia bacterium]